MLNCQKNEVSTFNEVDPFNPVNTVFGAICRKEGKYFGTRVFFQVNRKYVEIFEYHISYEKYIVIVPLSCFFESFKSRVYLILFRELKQPEIIYSTPNMQPYGRTQTKVDRNTYENLDISNVVNYFSANKWNGLNIQVFSVRFLKK